MDSLRDPLFPMRSFDVGIDRIQRDALSIKVQIFALRQNFESKTKLSSPDPDDIFFYLMRNDVQFMGTRRSRQGSRDLEYSFAFYRQRDRAPPSLAEIDSLMVSLKTLLGEVPGLMITNER